MQLFPLLKHVSPTHFQCKPEQVKAVQDSIEVMNGPYPKKDWLHYQTGEVIAVLDKRYLFYNFFTFNLLLYSKCSRWFPSELKMTFSAFYYVRLFKLLYYIKSYNIGTYYIIQTPFLVL